MSASQLTCRTDGVVIHLTPEFVVPANSSRFFDDAAEARAQPVGRARFAWRHSDPFVYNSLFDADQVRYDEAYCTTQFDEKQVASIATGEYFWSEVGPHLSSEARVVDIGCGQGEFVDYLRERGVEATGYDPVVRRTGRHFVPRYWRPEDGPADLFVMRCVLPHIESPWEFLRALGESHPSALVLIEFQSLENIVREALWYQLSHDHVNVFDVLDFEERFDLVGSGRFSGGEWTWVLIRVAASSEQPDLSRPPGAGLVRLSDARSSTLAAAEALGRPLYLWGAAGKGIVLAHALMAAGAEVAAAVDIDPNRQGKYMEVSGVEILSPARLRTSMDPGGVLLVCNPNHLESVHSDPDFASSAILPRDLGPGRPA